MNPSRPRSQARRRPLFRIEAESLESRQLLTGGAGNTIALVRGSVETDGATTPSAFTIQSTHFTAPRGRLTLGVDVVATTNSGLKPVITGVTTDGTPRSKVLYQGPRGAKALARAASGDVANAVLTDVTYPTKGKKNAANYSVKITGVGNTKGDFLIGYYLPGDADGNGIVNNLDIKAIKSLNGRTVVETDYSFDADTNRDGVINRTDVALARKNLGVRTTIIPDITANFDPASDTGAADRITNVSTVKFTGVAAPGASISYVEVNKKTGSASTVADDSGKYSVTLALAEGTNTYKVTSIDAFGQTISGSIQPVTYTTGTVPQTASVKAAV